LQLDHRDSSYYSREVKKGKGGCWGKKGETDEGKCGFGHVYGFDFPRSAH